MHLLKRTVRACAAKLGYERKRTKAPLITDPFAAMKQFVPAGVNPLILDVGANTGQSVERFKEAFPASVIHSFEPGKETFQKLARRVSCHKDVFPWNYAVGSAVGRQMFPENTNSDMSSFLELSSAGWGKVTKETPVEVVTIDRFLADQQISFVDILKSDTQGYDLEVFKGAEQAMHRQQIGLVYFEFIFSDMYKKLPAFDEVFRHLIDRDFALVSIYEFHHQNRLAGWCDALFVNKTYYAKST